MKKKTSFTTGCVAVLVLVCSIASYGAGSQEPQATGKPTPITFYRVDVSQDPKKDRLLIELQKRTNTEITFVTCPWDQEVTKIMSLLSSGETVDVMSINPSYVNFDQLCKDGVILQLDDYLKSGKYPIEKKIAYDPLYFKKYDVAGKCYSIPLPIQPGDWNSIIRKDWLDNVGLGIPRNPDEAYEVFKRFAYDDPDRNGKADTMCFFQDMDYGFHLMKMFMFYDKAIMFFDEIDGSIVYNHASPKEKRGLQFLNRLYREDLMNKDFAAVKRTQNADDLFYSGKTGWKSSGQVSNDINNVRKMNPKAEIAVLIPFPHDDGNPDGAFAVDSKWNWMVNILPRTCRNPGKTLELLEYLNSPAGRKLMSVGIEGIHYKSYKEVKGDGVFYGINTAEQDKDWDPSKVTGLVAAPMNFGLTCTIFGEVDYFKYPTLMECLKNSIDYVPEQDLSNPYWDMRKKGSFLTYHDPVPRMVPEFAAIKGQIDTYRAEYEVKMIMASSDEAFESAWREYLGKLDKAGLGKAVDAANAWYKANK